MSNSSVASVMPRIILQYGEVPQLHEHPLLVYHCKYILGL